MTLIQKYEIDVGPQFQNVMSLCCLFPWVEGLRKLGVLPENEEIFVFISHFLSFHLSQICSLACLKSKTEEILQKIFFKTIF